MNNQPRLAGAAMALLLAMALSPVQANTIEGSATDCIPDDIRFIDAPTSPTSQGIDTESSAVCQILNSDQGIGAPDPQVPPEVPCENIVSPGSEVCEMLLDDTGGVDGDATNGVGCQAFSANRWSYAKANCAWTCPYNASVIIAVVGGTLGMPDHVEGEAGCGGAECEGPSWLNPSPLSCIGVGKNYNGSELATCVGENHGWGKVNVMVECIAVGCGAPCNIGMTTSPTVYDVSAPDFDMSIVEPGDELCLPLAGCQTVAPVSIILMNGEEAYLPLGVRCFAGDCVPVTF